MDENEVQNGLRPSRKNWGDSSISSGWKRFWVVCGIGEALKVFLCSTIGCMGTTCSCYTLPPSCTCGFATIGIIFGLCIWIFGILLMIGTIISCIVPVLIPFIGWIFLAVVILMFAVFVLLCCLGLGCIISLPIIGFCLGCGVTSSCFWVGFPILFFPNPSLLLLVKLFGLLDIEDEKQYYGEDSCEEENEDNDEWKVRKPLPVREGKANESSESVEEELGDIKSFDEIIPISERPIEYSQEFSSNQRKDDEEVYTTGDFLKSNPRNKTPSKGLQTKNNEDENEESEEEYLSSMSVPPQSILESDLKEINIIAVGEDFELICNENEEKEEKVENEVEVGELKDEEVSLNLLEQEQIQQQKKEKEVEVRKNDASEIQHQLSIT